MTRLDRRTLLSAALLAPLVTSGTSAQTNDNRVSPISLGPSIPPELFSASGNWPVAQGDLSSHRKAVGSSIHSGNLDQLEVLWTFPISVNTGYGGMTATPIVNDDVVYLQDMMSNIFALDRSTGELRWQRSYFVPSAGPNGVAVAYGLLFASLGDTAAVVALDAASGKERWRVQLSNNPGEGISMVPAVYDSTVYVSTVPGRTDSFNRGGTRGILFALDASSGETLWQFDTTTDNLWGNPRINSGGGIWYPPSFDETGGMYFGVGNAAPWPGIEEYPNGSSRPGANDYASSMVALERATGAIRWHYNASEHDLLDHDFQNSPLLTEVKTTTGGRKLAIGSGKTGTVVAVDRMSGEVVWETRVGRHDGDDRESLPDQSAAIFPGAWGGILTPLACADGRVFAPVIDMSTNYSSTAYDRMSMFDFTNAKGVFVALDLMTGSVIWQTEISSPPMGGATIINDLVVFSTLDGRIHGLNVENGSLLVTYVLPAGINACPAVAGNMMIFPAGARRVSGPDSSISKESSQRAVVSLGIFDNM